MKGQGRTTGRAKGRRVAPGGQARKPAPVGRLRGWKLEDAKARFSEVVRRAREEGPQRVTYRGQDAVVVIAVEELTRLLPTDRPTQPLLEFLQSTALSEIDIGREPDRGRDVVL